MTTLIPVPTPSGPDMGNLGYIQPIDGRYFVLVWEGNDLKPEAVYRKEEQARGHLVTKSLIHYGK